MENSISIEKKNKARLSFSIKKFFILFKMLLQDKTKISFKANKKQSLIKLLSLAILFVLLCAISFMFYQVSMLLNIFAATRYVPQSVPTFFMSFLMIFGFISLVSGLNKTLYYSKDNKFQNPPISPIFQISDELKHSITNITEIYNFSDKVPDREKNDKIKDEKNTKSGTGCDPHKSNDFITKMGVNNHLVP